MRRSSIRSSIHWFLFGALVVTGALALAQQVRSAQDPVEELKQALTVRAEDRGSRSKEFLPHRDKVLEERVKALRTISDLRRALVEWKIEPDRFGPLQKVDEKWRGVVGRRLRERLEAASKSPQANIRLAVANMIADLGPGIPALDVADPSGYARSLTDIVIRLVRDRSPAVHQAATRALGDINADPDKAVPVLGDTLKNGESVTLRRVAADSLKRLIQVTTQLNKKLQTKSAEVVASAEELIKTCKDVAVKLGEVARSQAGLSDPDVQVRTLCLEALQSAGAAFSDLPGAFKKEDFPPSGRKLVEDELIDIRQKYERVRNEIDAVQPLLQAIVSDGPVLRQGLTDVSPRVRLAAATTLEEFSHIRLRMDQRVESLPALPNVAKPKLPKEYDKMIVAARSAMATVLDDWSNPVETRRRAMEYIENLSNDAAPALDSIIKALGDPDRFIRWAAARTIGRLTPEKSVFAVPSLAALLDDYDVDVRMAAARALERMGPRARGAVPALEAKILDRLSDPEFRIAVIYVLASIGTERTTSAIPLFIRALGDTDARVRRTAAEMLGKYGEQAESAIPALRQALADDDQEVRTRASDALLNILLDSAKE